MSGEYDELPALDPEWAYAQEERKYYRQRVESRFIGQPQNVIYQGLKFFVDAQDLEDPTDRDRKVYRELVKAGLINGGAAEMTQQYIDWRGMYKSSQPTWDSILRHFRNESESNEKDGEASS